MYYMYSMSHQLLWRQNVHLGQIAPIGACINYHSQGVIIDFSFCLEYINFITWKIIVIRLWMLAILIKCNILMGSIKLICFRINFIINKSIRSFEYACAKSSWSEGNWHIQTTRACLGDTYFRVCLLISWFRQTGFCVFFADRHYRF